MQTTYDFEAIPDDELLRRLVTLVANSRHTEADLVAHIGEVDARRLYVRQAAPSMFVCCTERLHLSEAEACLRIAAARASRQHPVLLEMLADGRVHLSAIAKLAKHLTPENRGELLRRATHRTNREIDELVAELAPRPDAPASIRRLPAGRFVGLPASKRSEVRAAISAPPSLALRSEGVDSYVSNVVSGAATAPGADRAPSGAEPARSGAAAGSDAVLRSGTVPPFDRGLSWVATRAPRRAVIEPLSPGRYKVQFTASVALRDKLERLQALMRSSIPDGDLAAIVEVAVTEKLERLEVRRFGRTKSPRRSVSTSHITPHTRHVPAAVKRAVDGRDQGRCRYADGAGHRCTARAGLQFHHRRPWAAAGDHSPGNVSMLCSVHNRHLAEIDFGRAAVGRHRLSTMRSPATPRQLTTG